MKVFYDNDTLRVVYDELLPRKVSPLDKDCKALMRDWKETTTRINARCKKPFAEFLALKRPTSEAHHLLIFCSYYHDYVTNVIDNDNMDISFAVNGIVKHLYAVPDDGPRFLSPLVVSVLRGEDYGNSSLMQWLKDHEDKSVMGTHTEAFLIDMNRLAIA